MIVSFSSLFFLAIYVYLLIMISVLVEQFYFLLLLSLIITDVIHFFLLLRQQDLCVCEYVRISMFFFEVLNKDQWKMIDWICRFVMEEIFFFFFSNKTISLSDAFHDKKKRTNIIILLRLTLENTFFPLLFVFSNDSKVISSDVFQR